MKYKIKKKYSKLVNEIGVLNAIDLKDHKKRLNDDIVFFQDWLSHGKHAEMHFLERHLEARTDPTLILPSAKTALVFLIPYSHGHRVRHKEHEPKSQGKKNSLYEKKLISKYVYSKDYHKVIKKYLIQYAENLQKELGISFNFRPIIDSVPFFERAYGRDVGLGFIGKNTLLIRPGMGSFFFIGTLLVDLDFSNFVEEDVKNNPIFSLDCGECRKCIDACPTQAIEEQKTINSNKCLSYLTIEHRDLVDSKYIKFFESTLYGCDICQDVCPYNYVTRNFEILSDLKHTNASVFTLTAENIATMTEAEYQKWFGGTAMTRAKYEGLVRNALYHLYATNSEHLTKILYDLKDSSYSLVRKTVAQVYSKMKKCP